MTHRRTAVMECLWCLNCYDEYDKLSKHIYKKHPLVAQQMITLVTEILDLTDTLEADRA